MVDYLALRERKHKGVNIVATGSGTKTTTIPNIDNDEEGTCLT